MKSNKYINDLIEDTTIDNSIDTPSDNPVDTSIDTSTNSSNKLSIVLQDILQKETPIKRKSQVDLLVENKELLIALRNAGFTIDEIVSHLNKRGIKSNKMSLTRAYKQIGCLKRTVKIKPNKSLKNT